MEVLPKLGLKVTHFSSERYVDKFNEELSPQTYDKVAKLTGHSSAGTLASYDHTVASDLGDKARADIKDI